MCESAELAHCNTEQLYGGVCSAARAHVICTKQSAWFWLRGHRVSPRGRMSQLNCALCMRVKRCGWNAW